MKHNLALLITAAGRSSRMGFPKGLIPVGSRTLIEVHCDAFRKLGGSHICIVQSKELAEQETYSSLFANQLNIQFVENCKVDETTMFYSLQLGLTALQEYDGVFLMPVDVAPFSEEVFRILSNGFSDDAKVVTPTFENQKGHPVLLSKEFCHYLLSLDAHSARLDREINLLTRGKVFCEVSEVAVLKNLNTPSAIAGSHLLQRASPFR